MMSERSKRVEREAEQGGVGEVVDDGAGDGDVHCCGMGCEDGVVVIVDALIFELQKGMERGGCVGDDLVEVGDELHSGEMGEVAA